jgi:hypothetical protein
VAIPCCRQFPAAGIDSDDKMKKNAQSAPESVRTIEPRTTIQRFHVFAEYSRLEILSKGAPPDEAKGFGLWIARVVARRQWKELKQQDAHEWGTTGSDKWLTLNSEPQTDQMFNEEIIESIGPEFYEEVFSPAIQRAFECGAKYREIRDTIRANWKPSSSYL